MYSIVSKMTVVLLTATLISGCSALSLFTPKPAEVVIKTVEIKIPITHPPMPRAIDLKEPQFLVVSEKNIDTFLVDIEKRAGQVVFVAITVDDYELMAYNMQEIKRYINQLKEVVVYYRTMNTDEPKKDETNTAETN